MKLTIANTDIHQDAEGRFSLNDLHRAAGSENRHRPSLWAENQQAKDLIAELESEAGIPALVAQHGGATSGTYVCKELVYAYAMWISPAFHLKVIRAYDSMATMPHLPPQQTARLPQLHPVRDLLLVGKAMSKVKGVNEALAMACTLDAIERTTGLPTTMLAKALPSVAPENAATLNATQVGEPLSLNGRAANAILEKIGLQYKDENKNWKPTEAGTAYGEMKPFHRNGHSGYETRWKPSVIEVLRNHMDAIEKSA